MTKDVISLSISVLLLFRHYISHKITFGAPSSGGVLRSACGAFIIFRSRIQKERERDISEKIALGLPNTGAAQQEQFDQRLFNQSKVKLTPHCIVL